MTPSYEAGELLDYTLATWVFELWVAGVQAADPEVAAACAAVQSASDAESGEAAGRALVASLSGRAGDGSPEGVGALARSLFGERVLADLGLGEREARLGRIRRHQFGQRLPWLARVWSREASGEVRPSWWLVEQVTDEVTVADPNPWNDIDEVRRVPVPDFQVLWELSGCASIAVARAAAA
jgi:hypothetical protein